MAPTPGERERWQAIWLLAQGWTASATADALGRDPHTIGRWVSAFGEGGPGPWFSNSPGVPPALDERQREELKAAVQKLPAAAGIGLTNWNWKLVHCFVWERFGLSRSSCLNWLHRLGFAFKRPKKRLVKVDEVKREAFVVEYAVLRDEAELNGGKVFFADKANSVPMPNYGTSGC